MPTVSISPAVQFFETDLTAIVPAVATSIGAFAGEFAWGPVMSPTTVENKGVLSSLFGKPVDSNYADYFSAENFLDYSSNLLLVRVKTAAQKNAVAAGVAIAIDNEDDYELNYETGNNSVGMFAAKYPGSLGNSLKVSMADASTYSRSISGTIAVTEDSTAVVGTSTQFVNEVSVGDYLTFVVGSTAFTAKVVTVTDATNLVLNNPVPATGTGISVTARWEYWDEFDGAPIDSDRAVDMGSSKDSMHIVIVDEDGKFSGKVGTVLQKFDNVFKSSDAKRFDGTSGYYLTVLKNSAYVWWMDHPASAQLSTTGIDFGQPAAVGAFKTLKKPLTVSLTGGADGFGATEGETITAFDLFRDDEKYDINLLFTGHAKPAVAKYAVQSIAENRMDCVAFLSCFDPDDNSFIIGDTSLNVDKMVEYRTETININSSYAFLDSGVKYQYDKYNDKYRWVPLNADMAGLCARTDYVAEAWFAPAGYNRGNVKNAIKLGVNPSKTMRDSMFKNGINPVMSQRGQGIVLFGDKTMQSKPSAFDAINVRRLFIVLEKSIATAAKYQLFEQNDAITRQIFVNMVTPFLRGVKGRRGIDDFLVDVGPLVNTSEVINLKQFKANIYVRPVGAIRNIILNFIATPYGVEFSEYVMGG
jgi:phage tail sheath protein FI